MKNSLLIVFILLVTLNIGCSKNGKTDCNNLPTVDAGTDVLLQNATNVSLKGKSNVSGGSWSIISGTGGTVNMVNDSAHFTGVLDNTYKLKFEVANDCGITTDTVNVSLESVDCGSRMTIDQMVDKITWLGQSTFKIQSAKYKIYTDPINISQNDDADIILITHSHGDHFSPASLNKLSTAKTYVFGPVDCNYSGTYFKRIVLLPGEEYTVNGCVKIKAVPAYNLTKTFHPKSNNWVGYLVTVNGVTIYHAGDTDRIPEMKTFTCDIALLPLGTTYTMNSIADAAESAKDVKAKVAIPMHYGSAEGNAADAFTFKALLDGIITVVIK